MIRIHATTMAIADVEEDTYHAHLESVSGKTPSFLGTHDGAAVFASSEQNSQRADNVIGFVNDGEKVLSATIYTEQEADGISFVANGAARINVTRYVLKEM